VERVLSTREFDPELRHTGVNIKKALDKNLNDFGIDASKIVFVTDRGANVLAAMKDSKHVSCCDHMTNTVLTHLFDNRSLQECPGIQSVLTANRIQGTGEVLQKIWADETSSQLFEARS
jgi:hypothetical protein